MFTYIQCLSHIQAVHPGRAYSVVVGYSSYLSGNASGIFNLVLQTKIEEIEFYRFDTLGTWDHSIESKDSG